MILICSSVKDVVSVQQNHVTHVGGGKSNVISVSHVGVALSGVTQSFVTMASKVFPAESNNLGISVMEGSHLVPLMKGQQPSTWTKDFIWTLSHTTALGCM